MAAPSTVFVYGTLMAPEVLKVLIGRVPDFLQPAILDHYRRHQVKEFVFPGMIPCLDNEGNIGTTIGNTITQGMLLQGLSDTELKVLDWFEGDEYSRRDVHVRVGEVSYPTQCYVWANPMSELDLTKEWDFHGFMNTKLDLYLTNTVRPCRVELDRLGIGKIEE